MIRKVCLSFFAELHWAAHFYSLFCDDFEARVEGFWKYPSGVLRVIVHTEEFDDGRQVQVVVAISWLTSQEW
jgi:hypothetical protein